MIGAFLLLVPALAFAFERGTWDGILKARVHDGRVDYRALKAEPQALESYVAGLGSFRESEYQALSREDQIAFWINAYNALTLKAILDRYPIRPSFPASLRYPKNSIRQIPGVWDKLEFVVLGRKTTLAGIEHRVLRKKFQEPRIHMALVCASLGCPPLRGEAYIGSHLDAQLDDQARAFLRDPAKFRIDRGAGRVYLSPIFKWFAEDFGGKPLDFIGRHIGPEDAKYLREGGYSVKYLDYDWALNEKS